MKVEVKIEPPVSKPEAALTWEQVCAVDGVYVMLNEEKTNMRYVVLCGYPLACLVDGSMNRASNWDGHKFRRTNERITVALQG